MLHDDIADGLVRLVLDEKPEIQRLRRKCGFILSFYFYPPPSWEFVKSDLCAFNRSTLEPRYVNRPTQFGRFAQGSLVLHIYTLFLVCCSGCLRWQLSRAQQWNATLQAEVLKLRSQLRSLR